MAVSTRDDHYAALGVPPDAPREEIEAAWRFLLVACHPDRFREPEQRRRAEEVTKRVNAAWQTLGDGGRRRRYDRARDGGAAAPPPPPPPDPERRDRELPCPSCATLVPVADVGGATVALTCRACGTGFDATVGTRCSRRPALERGWVRLGYAMPVVSRAGQPGVIRFRRLPKELALSEGELLSVVYSPRTGRPAYAVAHTSGVDMVFTVR